MAIKIKPNPKPVNTADPADMILKGKPKPAKKAQAKKPVASSFAVRPSTIAACEMVIGDPVAARLFHAFLELWVDTAKRIRREYEGETRDFLFLSSDDLQTLSGLTKKQIYDRAIPKLKDSGFFTITTMRLSPGSTNRYAIHFDEQAFWLEIATLLDPTKQTLVKQDGAAFVVSEIDRSKLPYLWKRLYDRISSSGQSSPNEKLLYAR